MIGAVTTAGGRGGRLEIHLNGAAAEAALQAIQTIALALETLNRLISQSEDGAASAVLLERPDEPIRLGREAMAELVAVVRPAVALRETHEEEDETDYRGRRSPVRGVAVEGVALGRS